MPSPSLKPPSLKSLAAQASSCTACAKSLPLGARPVFRAGAAARLLIVGQAPGRRVHESGIPWNDPSGDVLRAWLDIDRERFYDASRIAIVPMGLCYPGTRNGADLPPRPECGPRWQAPFRAALPRIELVLLVGSYAVNFHVRNRKKKTLTETVRAFRDYLPEYFVLPHPSWRNKFWIRRNPWFETEVIPELRLRVGRCLPTV